MIFGAAILVVVFYATRYAFGRYGSRPKYANAVAFAAVAIAFVALLAINRMGRPSNDAAVELPAPTSAATTAPAKDVTAGCRALPARIGKSGVGSLDAIVYGAGDANAVGKSDKMASGVPYAILGWGVSHDIKHLARAVCPIVDGKPLGGAISLYGEQRPDVENVFGIPSFVGAGFRIELAPGTLKRGTRTLAIAVVSNDGTVALLKNSRVVTVP